MSAPRIVIADDEAIIRLDLKEILEDVSEAAWDGQSMALLAMDDQGRFRVEFPAGRTVLQEDGAVSGVKCLRMARDGGQLAMVHSDSTQGTSAIETTSKMATPMKNR